MFDVFSPTASSLDVKKSSYKKLSKFLAAMQQRGFIQVKELSKGVESIVSIDQDHSELVWWQYLCIHYLWFVINSHYHHHHQCTDCLSVPTGCYQKRTGSYIYPWCLLCLYVFIYLLLVINLSIS